jgi:leucine dehydrogenase
MTAVLEAILYSHDATRNMSQEAVAKRRQLFSAYGRFVSGIGGVYYTAADMNTGMTDMVDVLSSTRYVTCLPPDHGGSGDPSQMTARGVFESMVAAWQEIQRDPTAQLAGVRVAVQGVGKVGESLVEYLARAQAKIWIADARPETAAAVAAANRTSGIVVVPAGDILRAPVDVISPCATGGVIDAKTIEQLHREVRLICGGANNILASEDSDAEQLHARGVILIPDFLCNRMGIINCADEWLGYLAEDIEKEIKGITVDTKELLARVARTGRNPLSEARGMADERLSSGQHPLIRLRGRGLRLTARFLRTLEQKRLDATASSLATTIE